MLGIAGQRGRANAKPSDVKTDFSANGAGALESRQAITLQLSPDFRIGMTTTAFVPI